jgi:hypothetical protein
MFSWDVSGGIQRKWSSLGNTTLWGGYTNSQDGIGGFTNALKNPNRLAGFNPRTGIRVLPSQGRALATRR